MNSKERVRAAIAGEPVDRVPLGFYAVDCDTVEKVIGRSTFVRDKIGSQIAMWQGRREEVVESYKKDTIEFYQKIDTADLILAKEAPLVPARDWVPESCQQLDDETWQDRRGRVYKVSHLSNELVCVHDPTARDVDDFTEEMFPGAEESEFEPPDPLVFEAQDYVGGILGEDRYLAGFTHQNGVLPMLGGQTTGLMVLALKSEVVLAASRRGTRIGNLMDAHYVRPYFEGMMWDQDLGTSRGPLISPAQFRDLVLPFLKRRLANLKGYGKQILMHNCGDNRLLMDMYVEAGVECYQSLQPNAGMDLEYLADHFGSRMTFWGGVPVDMLVAGTPDDVRRSVREAIAAGRRARGFILGPSHSVAYGTKYENFMAMVDEHRKLCHQV